MEVYEKLPFLVAFGHAAAGAPLIARIGAAVAHRKNMDESRFFGECEGICRSITEVSMASEGNRGGGMRSFGFECASCTYLCGIG